MNGQEISATTIQQETDELVKFVGLAVNGVAKDLKDGKFGNLSDHLPAILAAQPAFQGIGGIGDEAAIATVQDKENRRSALLSNMQDVEENDRYDLTQIITGALSGYSMGKRNGRKEGIVEGAEMERQRILTTLKNNGVKISTIPGL